MAIKLIINKFIDSWRKSIFHLAFVIHCQQSYYSDNIWEKIKLAVKISILEIALAAISAPFYLVYHHKSVHVFAEGIEAEKVQIYEPNYRARRRHGLLGM